MGDKTTDAAKVASEQAAKDAAAAQAAKDAQALKDAAAKDAEAKAKEEAEAAAEAKSKLEAEEAARAAEEAAALAAAPKVITVATVVGQMVNPLTGMVFDVGDRVDVVNPDCWVLAQLEAKKLVEI